MISDESNFFSIHTIHSVTTLIITMYMISSFLAQSWWFLLFSHLLYQSSNADTFHIVTSQDTPCPGEFSGVPCVSLQQYVSNPSISTGNITLLFQTGNHTLASVFSASSASSYTLTGEDVNIECVSSAAQWNFLSIQQVHMRGISFFRCHGGMTFRSIVVLNLENIKAQEYRIRGTNIECVSSTAQWNFLSIQQVYMRGISIFRCHGQMRFSNMEMLTMENIKVVEDNTRRYSNGAAITAGNVVQIYITICTFANCNGGVFSVRNSSMEISSSIFHNNYAQYYYGGVLHVYDYSMRGTYHNRITITNSTFTNNRGDTVHIQQRYGSYYRVVLSICNSSFGNHRAGYSGRAVYYSGYEEVNITHSMFTNNNGYSGGVIYSRSSVSITHCNISGNTANRRGGAIYSLSSVTAENSNISSNRGGAIYSSSYVLIINCTVSDNTEGIHGHSGGAVYSLSSVTATNCNISGNTASQHGGAIFSLSSVIVTNCNISSNTANQSGGAIYNQWHSVTISHATLSDNRASTQGGAFYSGSELICDRCEFLNNLAADGGAVFVNASSYFTSCEFYNNNAQNFGGAIHITGTNSSTSVLDGIFVNNTAVTLGGGAIYSNSRYSNVSISSSTFTHNTASYCSVLDVDEYYHFNVSITDSIFTSNTATGTLLGGGVACVRNASVTIRGSAFRYNHAHLHGGVFHMDESRVLVDESLFLNNSATANGGVFYTYLHPSAYEVRRSEFSYNSAGEDGGVLYIGRVNSRVTISQCVFTYNDASDRGGVAALIGSSLHIDVSRTHIFNNTARLGGIISACNSEVNVGAGELFMSADPVYSFCTLYNGNLINYNVSTHKNDVVFTSTVSPEQSDANTIQSFVSPTSTSFSLKSVSLSVQDRMSAHSSLELSFYQSNSHLSNLPPMSSAKVNVTKISSTNFRSISATPVEMLLQSTSGGQSSQLPSPTTSIKLSYSTQKTSVSLNTNNFIYTFSSLLNDKQISDLILQPSSTSNMENTVLQSLFPSTTSAVSSSQLPMSTANNKLSSSSQTCASPMNNNNMMTYPTSQNIKSETEPLATTARISLSSDLKSNITLALVLVWYVVVMILAVITVIYFIRKFYQKHSHKLSNFSLHEQKVIMNIL